MMRNTKTFSFGRSFQSAYHPFKWYDSNWHLIIYSDRSKGPCKEF